MSVEIIEVTTFNVIKFLALVIVIIISWVIVLVNVIKLFERIRAEHVLCQLIDEAQKNASLNPFSVFMHFFPFIFYAIGCGIFMIMNKPEFANSVKIKISIMLLVSLVPVNMLNEFSKDGRDILPNWPAMLDLYDGVVMLTAGKLNPRNSLWLQVVICSVVILFYIPVFLEIYQKRFESYLETYQNEYGAIRFSKRRITHAQFVTCFIFLALRLVLFKFKPLEIIFAAKAVVRLCFHYKTILKNPE